MYTNVAPLGIWAEAADECVGGQLSEPDGEYCCPWKTWSNGTYLQIKGEQSLQRLNEKRIHHALSLIFDEEVPGQSRLETIAGDTFTSSFQAVQVWPDFKDRLPRAVDNFRRLFPWDRWYVAENVIPTDCKADGAYNAWRAHAVPVDESARFSVTQGGDYNQWLGKSVPPNEGGALWTIRRVPGGCWDCVTVDMPKPSDLYVTTTEPMLKDGQWVGAGVPKIVPTAWTQEFLDTFAPPYKMTVADQPLKYVPQLNLIPAKTMKVLAPPDIRWEEDEETIFEQDETGETVVMAKPWMLAVGGAVVLGLVGGGVYLLARRK